jgi:hypothetical protein
MKILFVDTLYSSVLDGLGHLSAPGQKESFENLTNTLNQQKFAAGHMFGIELEQMGHKVQVVYVNSLKSQSSWSRANLNKLTNENPALWRHWQLLSRLPFIGQIIHNRSTLVKVLISQIEHMRPDIVYVLNINFLNRKLIRKIKDLGCLVVGQIASPLPSKKMFKEYDHIFSAHPGQVKLFKSLGISSSWLPLAFDVEHYERANQEGWPERHRDLTFVGTFGRHQKTTGPLLMALSKEIPTLEIFTFASGKRLKKYGLDRYLKGKAWGARMHQIFAESKIVINRHGAVADGYSVNYRLFEGTGMGALVVTESSKNITDLFEPGREILTYDSISNAVTIIKKALSDFDNYSKIAEAGQKRTLTNHTFKNRSQELEANLVRIAEGKRNAVGN